jgi:hypothetical protein
MNAKPKKIKLIRDLPLDAKLKAVKGAVFEVIRNDHNHPSSPNGVWVKNKTKGGENFKVLHYEFVWVEDD